jgi:hypothetical protein
MIFLTIVFANVLVEGRYHVMLLDQLGLLFEVTTITMAIFKNFFLLSSTGCTWVGVCRGLLIYTGGESPGPPGFF